MRECGRDRTREIEMYMADRVNGRMGMCRWWCVARSQVSVWMWCVCVYVAMWTAQMMIPKCAAIAMTSVTDRYVTVILIDAHGN